MLYEAAVLEVRVELLRYRREPPLRVAHRDVVSDDIIEHLLVRVDAEHLRIGVGVRVRVRVGVRVRVRVRVSLRPCGCRAPKDRG